MGIKINISGTEISGNSKVLNNANIQGKNNTNIKIKDTSINGNAQLLNDMKSSGENSIDIEVKNTKMTSNARVLNGIEPSNGEINLQIQDLNLGKNVEFMNNGKITNTQNSRQQAKSNATYSKMQTGARETIQNSRQQTESNPTYSTIQTGVKEITEIRNKREGLLKRILKAIFRIKNTEEPIQEYTQTDYKKFQEQMSRNGKLKNLDTTEAIHIVENSKEQAKSQNITR